MSVAVRPCPHCGGAGKVTVPTNKLGLRTIYDGIPIKADVRVGWFRKRVQNRIVAWQFPCYPCKGKGFN